MMKRQIPHDHAAVLDAMESLRRLEWSCLGGGDDEMALVILDARIAIMELFAKRRRTSCPAA
jgi:hypothetical protein